MIWRVWGWPGWWMAVSEVIVTSPPAWLALFRFDLIKIFTKLWWKLLMRHERRLISDDPDTLAIITIGNSSRVRGPADCCGYLNFSLSEWWITGRGERSLSATQLATAEEKFRQNISLLNLSSQYWLIIRQANTAHSPLSWTPRRSRGKMWRLKYWRLSFGPLGPASC